MHRLFTEGKEYTARSFYPTGLGRHSEAGRYVNENEKLRILEVNKETNELKVLNLSLGTSSAWFCITEDDFKKLIRFKD